MAKPGDGSVILNWLAPSTNGGSSIDQYAVQRAASADGPWTSIAFLDATAWTHKVTGLANGTTYHFRIRAHNSAGWGPATTVLEGTPLTVPSWPRSLAPTPGNKPVQLTWVAPASNGGAAIDQYQVLMQESGNSWWGMMGWPTSPGFTVPGLTPGKEYHFKVQAHNAAGWGTPTAYVTAIPYTVPGMPTACSAVQMSDSKTMYIDWGAPASDGFSPITSYRVDVYQYDGGMLQLVTEKVTAASDTDHYAMVPDFGDYSVNVTARNAAGDGYECHADVNLKDPDVP